MLSFIKNIFTKAEDSSSVNEFAEDKLITHLLSFINRTDLIAEQLRKYEQAKTLVDRDREIAYLQIFFSLENFILNNKPLVVKRAFTKESLRNDIVENIHLSRLKESFRLIFVSPSEQSLLLGEIGIKSLADYIQKHLSVTRLKYVVATAVSGTILRSLVVNETSLDFSGLDKVSKNFTESNIVHAFRAFFGALLEEISSSLGEKNANLVIRSVYDFTEASFEPQIVSKFLELVPDGYLDNEKLAHLSRQELESKAATALASEKLRRELAEKLLQDSRRLEQSLREERDRVHTIISSMGEGLFVVDQSMNILLVNPAARAMLEVSTDNPIGQDVSNMVSLMKGDEELDTETGLLSEALKSGQVVATTPEDNYYFRSKSGKKFPVNLTITPLLGQRINGLVIVFHDVTAEKKLSEAREYFISIASHQLRTPLTPIRWFSQMLLEGLSGPLTEEQRNIADYIYQSCDRLINLLNILLQISRVETGRLRVAPVELDLVQLTNKVVAASKPLTDAKHIRVVVHPSPLPKILLDETIMFQVIQNLLSNAVRYSPQKSQVDINIVQNGKNIEYSIEDRGVGIPKDQQSKIFDKFFRARNALKMVPEGSGLGLSLVKALVEGWGGKIKFSSVENKGTTFTVTMPLLGMSSREGEVTLAV